MWNDLQIDQWEDTGVQESGNDQFWNQQLNFDVEHYIDKTHEEEISKHFAYNPPERQKQETPVQQV